MAALSPTPLGTSHEGFIRRAPSRAAIRNQPLRPALKRSSPRSAMHNLNDGPLPQSWKFSMGDSSDDEIPVPPMKFSAEAKAILGDEASVMEHSSPSRKNSYLGADKAEGRERKGPDRSAPPPKPFRPGMREKSASPASIHSGSPRIVRINAGNAASTKPGAPTSQHRQSPLSQPNDDWITPAPRIRSRAAITTSSGSGVSDMGSSDRASNRQTSTTPGEPAPDSDQRNIHDVASQIGNLSIGRKTEETGVHTSIRVKRLGGVGGRYLSGPARRGMKRRQSEEAQSPKHEDVLPPDEPPASGEGALTRQERPSSPLIEIREDAAAKTSEDRKPQVRFQSQPTVLAESPARDEYRLQKPLEPLSQPKPTSTSAHHSNALSSKRDQPVFKVPALPPLPSRYDQENEPPPTFKRNKPSAGALLDRPQKISVLHDDKMLIDTPATASPQRQALAPRSQNTPYRPAPPPPKMTMLETATATAGAASASQSRKKRNYISVNSKLFTRMDCVGRGGSSKVYRVMAENFKVFALKRVTLEDQDEASIRGFKGEIDLLKRLENVDRVVRLFDYEINEEKQTLSVLMEMGESDLNRVLTLRLNCEDARFDITFTRYFWKEMLECVEAVHEHDIVHSDLKPANFLLLQGRLKLIDFGISNAISDNTVNVHREQHIGTPNYMSPEALIDSNAASGLPSSVGKMMKLGKPSDVWSLGCILYQMVYGKPPFAHIANQMQRIMAIPNPHHAIDFPEKAVGAVPVPFGLIRTLRRCLNRDQTQRPTVTEMLSPGDPFLDPDTFSLGTVPVGVDMITRLQHSMIKHIKEKGMPSEVELASWPQRYYASIKAAVEEGR
ncbi:MAG: hypothetical protein L6R39_003464 [Caloplaca ligustica]|nr:MAG: hypothetical protein L6R39_003464 [Caloplaca ligustica]